MRFCPSCGATLPQPNPTVCPSCGVNLAAAAQPSREGERLSRKRARRQPGIDLHQVQSTLQQHALKRHHFLAIYTFIVNEPLLFTLLFILSAFIHVWPLIIALGFALVCPLVFHVEQFGFERKVAEWLGYHGNRRSVQPAGYMQGQPPMDQPQNGMGQPAGPQVAQPQAPVQKRGFRLHFRPSLELILGIVALAIGYALYSTYHTPSMAGLSQAAAVLAGGSMTSSGAALVIGETALLYGALATAGGLLKGLLRHSGGGFFKFLGLLGLIVGTVLVLVAYANPALAGLSTGQTTTGVATTLSAFGQVYAFASHLPLYSSIAYGIGIALNTFRWR